MDRINFPDKSGQRFGKTELKYLQDSMIAEFRDRGIRQSSPGIVASSDPALAGSPLDVRVDSDAREFVISPGACLLDSGELLISESEIRLALPLDGRNYLLVLSAADAYFNDQVTSNEETIQTLVRTNARVSLVALAQYAAYVANSEFIAQYSETNGLSLTHEIITLRRWSSAADWVHRGQKGSGLATTSNPHGTTVFDMALNASTAFWPALDDDGLVVAGCSAESPKVRGRLIREILNPNQWSWSYGLIMAKLRYSPMHIVSVTQQIPGSPRLLVTVPVDANAQELPEGGEWSKTVIVMESGGDIEYPTEVVYYVAAALNFYVSATNSYELLSLEAQPTDILVVAGQHLAMASSYSFDLSDRADFMSRYHVRASHLSGIYLYPRMVIKAVELADLTSITSYNLKLAVQGQLLILMANTEPDDNLAVQVRVVGKDVNGQSISETVAFDSNWYQGLHDNAVMTVNSYSELTSLQVLSANSDIRSILQVQALGDTAFTNLAEFSLEQTGLSNLNDQRDILPAPLASRPASGFEWSEYFNNPRHSEMNGGQYYRNINADEWIDHAYSGALPSRYLKGGYISAPIKLSSRDSDSGAYYLILDVDGQIGPDLRLEVYDYSGNSGEASNMEYSWIGKTITMHYPHLDSYSNRALVVALYTDGQTKLKAVHIRTGTGNNELELLE